MISRWIIPKQYFTDSAVPAPGKPEGMNEKNSDAFDRGDAPSLNAFRLWL
jgi:hypothetical protein